MEKVTFDSIKFGDVVLRSVGKNVGNVKLGMHESSKDMRKNVGSGRKMEENPLKKKFGQEKKAVGGLNLGGGSLLKKKRKCPDRTERVGGVL